MCCIRLEVEDNTPVLTIIAGEASVACLTLLSGAGAVCEHEAHNNTTLLSL